MDYDYLEGKYFIDQPMSKLNDIDNIGNAKIGRVVKYLGEQELGSYVTDHIFCLSYCIEDGDDYYYVSYLYGTPSFLPWIFFDTKTKAEDFIEYLLRKYAVHQDDLE